MTGESPRPILQSRGRIAAQERRVRDEDPVVVQSGAAAIRAIEDRDRADRRRSSQIYLPPRIGVGIRGRYRAVEVVPVRVPVNRHIRARTARVRAALRRDLTLRHISGGRSASEDLHFRQTQVVLTTQLYPHVAPL